MSTGMSGEPIASAHVDITAETSKADAAFAKLRARLIEQAQKVDDAAKRATERVLANLERQAAAEERAVQRAIASKARAEAAAQKALDRELAAIDRKIAAEDKAIAAADKAAVKEAAARDRATAAAEKAFYRRVAAAEKAATAEAGAAQKAAAAAGIADYRAQSGLSGMRGGRDLASGGLPGRSDGKSGRGGLGGAADDITRTGDAAKNSSYKLLMFGNLIDDLQYVPQQGLRPILNNIMQFAPAIGIALIAIDSLAKAFGGWDKLIATGHTKTEAERMEELEKATDRTAQATKRLVKYKEQQSTIEKLSTAKGATQQTQASKINEALTETTIPGGVEGSDRFDAIVNKFAEANRKELIARDKTGPAGQLQAKLNRRGSDIEYGVGYNQIRADNAKANDPEYQRLNAALEARVRERAQAEVADAMNSPSKLAALIKKVESNPGAYPQDFGAQLRAGTPEAINRAKQDATTAKFDKAQDEEDEMLRGADEKDQQRQDSLADQKAAALAKRYEVEVLSGKGPDAEAIRIGLRQQGVGEADTAAITNKVLKSLNESIEEKVKQYSTEHGTSMEASKQAVLLQAKMDKATAEKNNPQAKLLETMRPQMHSIQGYFDKLTMAKTQDPMMKLAIEQNKILGKIEEAVKKKTVSRYGNRQS